LKYSYPRECLWGIGSNNNWPTIWRPQQDKKMKNLFLSLLVATAAVACNATYAVSDAADANAPAGECATECATSCSEAQKAECSAAKEECSAQVCPVTGEKLEG
jgi:hypothetical protein